MSEVVTRRVTRDKLAAVFKSHELVKLVESLTQDVTQTLPDRSDAAQAAADAAQDAANAARDDAAAAQADADAAQNAADTAQATATAAMERADALSLGIFLRPAPPAPPAIPANDAQAILANRVFRSLA